MNIDRTVTAQTYRSLVLSHLYILAREKNTRMRDIPQQTLARFGVSRRVDATSVTTFEVRVPEDLESSMVKGMVQRFLHEIEANRKLFPEAPPADAKVVKFRPRKEAEKKKAVEEFDFEPLDEKALLGMASAP